MYVVSQFIGGIRKYEKKMNRFESLLFAFLNKTWFEDIVGIKKWSELHWHMNLKDSLLLTAKLLESRYPLIIRYFENCWSVLYKDVNYFGNVIDVFFKYKKILVEDFESKIPERYDTLKTFNIQNFLVFKTQRHRRDLREKRENPTRRRRRRRKGNEQVVKRNIKI